MKPNAPLPEWTDVQGLRHLYGIREGLAHKWIRSGKIKSVIVKMEPTPSTESAWLSRIPSGSFSPRRSTTHPLKLAPAAKAAAASRSVNVDTIFVKMPARLHPTLSSRVNPYRHQRTNVDGQERNRAPVLREQRNRRLLAEPRGSPRPKLAEHSLPTLRLPIGFRRALQMKLSTKRRAAPARRSPSLKLNPSADQSMNFRCHKIINRGRGCKP